MFQPGHFKGIEAEKEHLQQQLFAQQLILSDLEKCEI